MLAGMLARLGWGTEILPVFRPLGRCGEQCPGDILWRVRDWLWHGAGWTANGAAGGDWAATGLRSRGPFMGYSSLGVTPQRAWRVLSVVYSAVVTAMSVAPR